MTKPDQEFLYPIYKKSSITGVVIKFDGLKSGVVIEKGSSPLSIGEFRYDWIAHTSGLWEDWTPPEEPKTKTVYEWMVFDGENWSVRYELRTEHDADQYFKCFVACAKTGRSWEVPV